MEREFLEAHGQKRFQGNMLGITRCRVRRATPQGTEKRQCKVWEPWGGRDGESTEGRGDISTGVCGGSHLA